MAEIFAMSFSVCKNQTMAIRLTLLLCVLSIGINLSAQTNTPSVNFKFGKGVEIVAADSSAALRASFRFQNLFVSERSLASDGAWESGFTIRRARLKFNGWAFDPKLDYYFQLGLSASDMNNTQDADETGKMPKMILDAYVKYELHKNLRILVGQAILPGNRERVISSQKQQFVDRTEVNSIFNLDRDMGVQLHGRFHQGNMVVKPIFAWSLGEGRNVTENIGGFNYTGRLELLPMGDFSGKGDYTAADLAREKAPKIAFGLTYNLNNRAARERQTGSFLKDTTGTYMVHDLQTIYADVIFKYQGFSFQSEFAHKKITDMKPPKGSDANPIEELIDASGRSYLTGLGYMAQAGYLFKNNWELAARYSKVVPDYQHAFKQEKEYAFGISKYISAHNLKVQGDISLADIEGESSNSLRYRIQFEFGI